MALSRALSGGLLIFVALLFTGCPKPGDATGVLSSGKTIPKPSATPAPPPFVGAPFSLNISWTANREKAVNSAGGGYKVYYSLISGFSLNQGTMIDIPYVSGPLAPTTATISNLTIHSATYYIRVHGYSSMLTPAGGASIGVVSDQMAIFAK
jgi:hypothetical protein